MTRRGGEHNHHHRAFDDSLTGQDPKSAKPQEADNNIADTSHEQHSSNVDPMYHQASGSMPGIPMSTSHPNYIGRISSAPGVQAPVGYSQNTMADTESQYSEETLVGARPVSVSRAFSMPFTFWERLNGRGKKRVGWSSSFRAIATFTCKLELFVFFHLPHNCLSPRRA
jgi:hypothetical protein